MKIYLDKEIDPGFRRRARWILQQVYKAAKGKRVNILEVGCGRGFYIRTLHQLFPNAKIVGIDLNNQYLQKLTEEMRNVSNVNIYQGDARKLNFKNNSFDIVICSEVLEHIGDDESVIREIYRVLKPKGRALFSVPHSPYPFMWDPINWVLERTIQKHLPSRIWWMSGIWADHVRLYDEKDLLVKLVNSGLKVEQLERSLHYCLPGAHFLFYGVGKNIVEKGWMPDFNRFKQHTKKSNLFKIIQKIISFWDVKNDKVQLNKNDSYLNIMVLTQK